MTIINRIWDFPALKNAKQLFYVPGGAIDGGFTSGGSRIISPEPGGRAFLDFQPSLSVNEWDAPTAGWLMSKINGQIFRVQLANTPQVLQGTYAATYSAAALEGSTTLKFNMAPYGQLLKPGHVIGHADNCYLIDDITYDGDNIATLSVTPPLRRNVAIGDAVVFRPYFLGTISNGDQIKATYDAENNGHIQIGLITFHEALIDE